MKIYKIIHKESGEHITRGYGSKASWKTWPTEALKGLFHHDYYVQEYELVESKKYDINRNEIK